MIRDKLCDAIRDYKIANSFTYTELQDITKLSRSQLFNILNNDGAGVKVERIENAVLQCGMDIKMRVLL